MSAELEARVKAVMAAVLGLEAEHIDEHVTPETTPGWDSFRHMSLVAALEEEFQVEFTDNQIADLLNYKLILHMLAEARG